MIETICEFCKNIFKKDNNKSKRNFCSKKCKDTWQKEGLKGKGNPFFEKHHKLETRGLFKNLKIGTHHTEE